MKFMESKIVAKVIQDGKVIENESIICRGNASYRVKFGETMVDYIFDSEEKATEYAVYLAKVNSYVLLGLASVEVC